MCVVIDLKNPVDGKDGKMHDRLECLRDYHNTFGDIITLVYWDGDAKSYDEQLSGDFCACSVNTFPLLESKGLIHLKDFKLDWEDFDVKA